MRCLTLFCFGNKLSLFELCYGLKPLVSLVDFFGFRLARVELMTFSQRFRVSFMGKDRILEVDMFAIFGRMGGQKP